MWRDALSGIVFPKVTACQRSLLEHDPCPGRRVITEVSLSFLNTLGILSCTSIPLTVSLVVLAVPVSYTHLDVYKRQCLLWLSNINILMVLLNLSPTLVERQFVISPGRSLLFKPRDGSQFVLNRVSSP